MSHYYKRRFFLLIAPSLLIASNVIGCQQSYSVDEATKDLSVHKVEAIKYLDENAQRGNVEAALALGYYYSHEFGTGSELRPFSKVRNESKSINYFKIASDEGNAEGMVRLADAFQYGKGIIKNERYASTLLEQAYSLGSSTAAFRKGVKSLVQSEACYSDELRIEKNYDYKMIAACPVEGQRLFDQAVVFLQQAVERGNASERFVAANTLADAYEKKWPNHNSDRANYWADISAKAQLEARENRVNIQWP